MITPRQSAALKGETFYFTGKRCSRGHLDKRYVSTGSCVACLAESNDAQHRALRALALKGRSAELEQENPERARAARRMAVERVGEVRIHMEAENVEKVTAFIQSLDAARFPGLEWDEYFSMPRRLKDEVWVYRVHPSDEKTARVFAKQFDISDRKRPVLSPTMEERAREPIKRPDASQREDTSTPAAWVKGGRLK